MYALYSYLIIMYVCDCCKGKGNIHLEKHGKLGQKTQNKKCSRETKTKPKNNRKQREKTRMNQNHRNVK
jgi:hypothetical protein